MKSKAKFYAIRIESWTRLKWIPDLRIKAEDTLGSSVIFQTRKPSNQALKELFKTALLDVEANTVEMKLFYDHKELKKWRHCKQPG